MSTIEILANLFLPNGIINITGERECFVTTAANRKQDAHTDHHERNNCIYY